MTELIGLNIRYNFLLKMIGKYIKVFYEDVFNEISEKMKIDVINIQVIYEHYKKRVVKIESSDNRKFYIKMYDDLNNKLSNLRYNNEVKFLKLFQNDGIIPVPNIVCYSIRDKDKDGKKLDVISGYIVTENVEGEQISDFANYIEQLTDIISHMKSFKSDVGLFIDNEFTTDEFDAFEKVKEYYKWLNVINNTSEYELCHNDLHSENILVNNGKIVSILDWELAGFFPKDYEKFKYDYLKEQYQYVLKAFQ